MTSPFRNSSRSSSTPRSSPSRNLSNGKPRPNGYHPSPLNNPLADSPSRQLEQDFGRMLLNDERVFKQSLDEQTAVQQRLHLEALDRALAKHEEVRDSAERARERADLELERERRRRDEEEQKAVEKARRDLEQQKIEQERRRLDEARAKEEETRQQELLKRDQEALERQRRERSMREQEEARRREELRKEEDARKLQEAAPSKPNALVNGAGSPATGQQGPPSAGPIATPTATHQPNGVASATGKPSATASTQPTPTASKPQAEATAGLPLALFTDQHEREAVHKQYLDLHRRLKQMRGQVLEECKKVPGLKNQVSDWRRSIVKCCGQMGKGTSDEVKAANKRATMEIVQQLDAAVNIAEPSINVTQYLVQNHQPANANTQGPAVLVFLLNHFAKNIVKQFISESAVDAKSADSLGVLAVTIFARPKYLFNGQTLIDLLWAKYHVQCPVLFGISGSERTKAGRQRLGWPLSPEGNGFASQQQHYDRITGLGVGFAAITLRDFSKSQNSNPAPNRIFWQSMARLLNIPPAEVQPTHFVLLKAMIDGYVPRIIGLFGGAGIALLRQALVDFPQEKGPQDANGRKVPSVTALQAMPMVLQRDHNLTL